MSTSAGGEGEDASSSGGFHAFAHLKPLHRGLAVKFPGPTFDKLFHALS